MVRLMPRNLGGTTDPPSHSRAGAFFITERMLNVMAKELKKYGVNELREMYLSFFESKEHLRLPSFSLVPQNDKSLLLINAGMTPLKP